MLECSPEREILFVETLFSADKNTPSEAVYVSGKHKYCFVINEGIGYFHTRREMKALMFYARTHSVVHVCIFNSNFERKYYDIFKFQIY